MPICIIRFSDRGRSRLSKIYTCVSVKCCTACVLLVINCLYINFTVAQHLHSEKAAIILIFTVIAMLGIQLTLYYLAGIFICRKCHEEAYKKKSRYLLKIWTFSGFCLVINVAVIGAMAAGVSNHIVRSMHYSMERGMKHYLKDIHWKKVIDSLQYRMQCCGSYGYNDWHKISWMSTFHVINSSEIIKKYEISGKRIFVPAVPWSCCRLDYDKQCFHDPIQQYQYINNWDTLSSESVYNIGCIELLRQPIENSFLFFILTSFLLLLLQIILTIISKYLYTSYKNAIMQGDPFGVAPGYLFGEDVSYWRGQITSDVSLGSRRSASVEEDYSPRYRSGQDQHTDYDCRSEDEKTLMM